MMDGIISVTPLLILAYNPIPKKNIKYPQLYHLCLYFILFQITNKR